MDPNDVTGENGPHRFDTTHWSLVLSSADSAADSAESRAALTQLCHIYWRPIFAFICRRGYLVDDAKDLTQDFFVRIIEGDLLQRASPERGRFRSLLLTALQNFLNDEHSKKARVKRGGEVKFVSWDEWVTEAPSRLSLPTRAFDSWPAERLFDVRWAATVVERTLARLREECEARGRRRVYDVLSGLLCAERVEVSYDELGRRLGIAGGTVKRLIYQMRRRYRELLRDEVSKTVEKEEDVDDELRYLCAALASEDG